MNPRNLRPWEMIMAFGIKTPNSSASVGMSGVDTIKSSMLHTNWSDPSL